MSVLSAPLKAIEKRHIHVATAKEWPPPLPMGGKGPAGPRVVQRSTRTSAKPMRARPNQRARKYFQRLVPRTCEEGLRAGEWGGNEEATTMHGGRGQSRCLQGGGEVSREFGTGHPR